MNRDARQRPPAVVQLTVRIALREVAESDDEALIRLWTHPLVRSHLGGPLSAEDAKRRAAGAVGRAGAFVIEERSTGDVVGVCSLTEARGDLEVSYELHPEYWHRGLAHEAVTALIGWAFARGRNHRVIAVTQTSNTRSRRLLERLGMRRVDEFIEFGEPQTMYSLERP